MADNGGYLANVLNWKRSTARSGAYNWRSDNGHRADPVGYSDYSALSLHPFAAESARAARRPRRSRREAGLPVGGRFAPVVAGSLRPSARWSS